MNGGIVSYLPVIIFSKYSGCEYLPCSFWNGILLNAWNIGSTAFSVVSIWTAYNHVVWKLSLHPSFFSFSSPSVAIKSLLYLACAYFSYSFFLIMVVLVEKQGCSKMKPVPRYTCVVRWVFSFNIHILQCVVFRFSFLPLAPTLLLCSPNGRIRWITYL